MKSTGIVRKVDELGRVVIPIELRRVLQIGEKDTLEIYVDGDSIILRKYEPTCIFCSNNDVRLFRGKNVCTSCLEELQQISCGEGGGQQPSSSSESSASIA
jgi:transcriptional pleiotropic regulator of transition state genes